MALSLGFLGAALLSLLLYHPVINSFFVLDDFVWMECAEDSGQDLAHIFNLNISNFFRPVVHLVFAVGFALWKASPVGFHLLQLSLHVLCTVLLILFVLLLTGRRFTALLAGLIFLAIPAYSEAVVWISAITEPIYIAGTLCTLTAWLCFLRPGSVGPRYPICFGLALLCFIVTLGAKESSVSLLPLMVLLHLGLRYMDRARPISPWSYLPFVIILGGFLALHFKLQQSNYLLDIGLYQIGLHGLPSVFHSIVHLLKSCWPPLGASLVGLLILRVPRQELLRLLPLALLLLLALVTALLPYAMFRAPLVVGRYNYLPAILTALAAAMALAPLAISGRLAGRILVALALAGLLFHGHGVITKHVYDHLRKAQSTHSFVDAARRLQILNTKMIMVNSPLPVMQLNGAMRLFHPAHPKQRFLVLGRDKLPRRWRHRSVWKWDPVSEGFHEISPPPR